MFGIGLPEFILILALALIVVGPEKLPDLAKTLAKQFLELKKTANALQQSLRDEMKEADREAARPEALPGAPHTAAEDKKEDGHPVIDVEAQPSQPAGHGHETEAAVESTRKNDMPDQAEKKS
ncbi:MAG: twin-arginine translocase TatA/TatE family subunit [Deltaproteobacteria bacterium]|nr:twin-arginine translocase TatA/TatE family subunit [Deltaproteobacteria bacterium]